jgi:hypothetical protein
MKQNRDWVGAGAGFLFVVLTVVAGGIGGTHPFSTGPIEPIRALFASNPGPFAVQTANYIESVATLLLVVVGASLAHRLWLGAQQILGVAAFGAVVLVAAIDFIQTALLSVLAFSVSSDGDVGAIKALYALRHIFLAYIYFPLALLAFALGIGTLVAGVFPRWFGWLNLAVGLAFLSGGADVDRSGFFMSQGDHWFYILLMFALWMLLTSGLLLRRTRAIE